MKKYNSCLKVCFNSFGIALTLGLFLPMIVVVILAFSDGSNLTFPPSAYSFKWFNAFANSPDFVRSLFQSLIIAAIAGLSSLVVGGTASVWVSRNTGRIAGFFEFVLLSPLFIATIALGLSLSEFYILVGIPKSPLAIALGHSLLGSAYVARLSLASLRRVGLAPERAARSLGCGPVRSFFKVTLPSARAGLVGGLLFAILISLDDIDISLFLSDVYTTTLPVRIFSHVEQNSDPLAAAVSAVLVGIAATFLFVIDRTVGVGELFGVNTRDRVR
jgi:putative spermidine/putrescine transport system permease protein